MPKITPQIRKYRADIANQAANHAMDNRINVSREIMLRCDVTRIDKRVLAYIASMWNDHMPVGEIARSLSRRGVFAIHQMSLTALDIYALLYELYRAGKVKDRVLIGLDYHDQDLTLEEFRKLLLMWQLGASAGVMARSLSPAIKGGKKRKVVPTLVTALYRRASHLADLKRKAKAGGANIFDDASNPGTTDAPNVNYYFADPKTVTYFRPPARIPDPFNPENEDKAAADAGEYDEFNAMLDIAPQVEVENDEFARSILDTVNKSTESVKPKHTKTVTKEAVDAELIEMIEAADADLRATGIVYDRLEELAREADERDEEERMARQLANRLKRRDKFAAEKTTAPAKSAPTPPPTPEPLDLDDLAAPPRADPRRPNIETIPKVVAPPIAPPPTPDTTITDDEKDDAIRELMRRRRRPQP